MSKAAGTTLTTMNCHATTAFHRLVWSSEDAPTTTIGLHQVLMAPKPYICKLVGALVIFSTSELVVGMGVHPLEGIKQKSSSQPF